MPRVLSNRGREMTLLLTGVDFVKTLTVLDDDGQPVDVTDATFVAHIRRFHDSGDPLGEFTVEVDDGELGTVTMTMSAADAAALTFDRAKWSLRMTLSDVVSQPYYGDVSFTPDPSG